MRFVDADTANELVGNLRDANANRTPISNLKLSWAGRLLSSTTTSFLTTNPALESEKVGGCHQLLPASQVPDFLVYSVTSLSINDTQVLSERESISVDSVSSATTEDSSGFEGEASLLHPTSSISSPLEDTYLQFGQFPPFLPDDSPVLRVYGTRRIVKRGRLPNIPMDVSDDSSIDTNWAFSYESFGILENELAVMDEDHYCSKILKHSLVGATQDSPIGPLLLKEITPETALCLCQKEEYIAKNLRTAEDLLVRFGDLNTDHRLKNEFLILEYLREIGISPKPFFISPPSQGYVFEARYLVTELMGQPLYFASKRMTRSQLLDVGTLVLDTIEILHRVGIVHGDLSEFSIRYCAERRKIYLADFEHARFFPQEIYIPRDPVLRRPTHPISNPLKLNYRQKSPWEIAGINPYSRRDDLYRWIETLARSMLGPEYEQWFESITKKRMDLYLKFKTEAGIFMTASSKNAIAWNDCSASVRKQLHAEFGRILAHIRSLNIHEKPDYQFLRNSLSNVKNILSYCSS